MTTETMKAENEFYRVLNEIVRENKQQQNLELFPAMIAQSRNQPEDGDRLDVFVDMVQKNNQEAAPRAKEVKQATKTKAPVLGIITDALIFAIGLLIGIILTI